MKTKLIALNVLLAAGIAAIAWQVNLSWKQAAAERQANLNVRTRPVTVAPAVPLPKPEGATPAQYAQVAEKNLFSSDRNPTVVIEVEKKDPPKPMPPLPVVYGVMGLPSGVKAIMAEKPGQQNRSVHAGETIGEFKVLALDTQNIKFEWNGKEISKRIDELVDRSNPQSGGGAGNNSGPAAPPPSQPQAIAAPQTPIEPNLDPKLGVSLTETSRACRPGDTAPAGTVADGFRKILTPSPFGTVCRWSK